MALQLSKRLTAFVALALSAGLSLSGCGSGNTGNASPSASDTRHSGDSSFISVNSNEPSEKLVPGNTNDYGVKVIGAIFSGLVRYDAQGRTHYEVAKDIKANQDATEFTITIKDGWKFTNGEPVTSESFAKAWSFTANAANAQKNASFFDEIEGYDALQQPWTAKDKQLSGLSTPDDSTLVVRLSQPDSTFPDRLGYVGYFPLPDAAYKDIDAFGSKPIGNGPYKFASWDNGKDIKVVKNPQYHGARTAKNSGVDFIFYTDVQAAYRDVQAGNLDLLDSLPTSALKTFKDDRTIQPFTQKGSSYTGFAIPATIKHFGRDKEGRLRRQALSEAIDRASVVKKIFAGTSTPAVDYTAPVISGYSTSLKGNDVLEYNPDNAKKLWDEANKISPWNGSTVKIAYSADRGAKPWVDAVTNYIANTLNIKAEGYAFPTYSALLEYISGNDVNTGFTTGWKPDYPSAGNYLAPKYSIAAADGKGSNTSNYKNQQFDGLLAKAAASSDKQTANKYYQQSEEILLQDLPEIPLWNADVSAAGSKNISNVKFDFEDFPIYNEITK